MVSKNITKKLKYGVVAAVIFAAGWLGGSGVISSHFTSNRGEQKQLSAHLDYSSVNEVYKQLRANFDGPLDGTKLTDGLKTGLVNAAGDPHTEYLNKADYKTFNDQLDGSFSGIGAELSQNSQNQIEVISPIAGYPAAKAGLQPKDIIAAINGKTTAGMNVAQAVNVIRGPAGSTVSLTIIRGEAMPTEVKIVRQNITIPSVKAEVKDGIGYMTISRFGDDTAALARQAAADFKQQKVKGVVIDLRDNPGGLLSAAVDVSSLWIPEGQPVLTERTNGQITQTYNAEGGNVLNGIPTTVLINGGSASASEITAGALHDSHQATLIGQKSYGKGSVQQVVILKAGGALKVTIARWYTPNGKNIDKAGINPDQAVGLTLDQVKAGQDPQLDAATAAVK